MHSTPTSARTPNSSSSTPHSATQLLRGMGGRVDNDASRGTRSDVAMTDRSNTHAPEVLVSLTGHSGATPELPDTGFYRPRVELATHSQSELINVPLRQRNTSPPVYEMIQDDPCLDCSPHLDSQGNAANGDVDGDNKNRNLYQPSPLYTPERPVDAPAPAPAGVSPKRAGRTKEEAENLRRGHQGSEGYTSSGTNSTSEVTKS